VSKLSLESCDSDHRSSEPGRLHPRPIQSLGLTVTWWFGYLPGTWSYTFIAGGGSEMLVVHDLSCGWIPVVIFFINRKLNRPWQNVARSWLVESTTLNPFRSVYSCSCANLLTTLENGTSRSRYETLHITVMLVRSKLLYQTYPQRLMKLTFFSSNLDINLR
jgi:hypothetical protein